MSDFVPAVHTETGLIQKVPAHFIEELPYLKKATKKQLAEAKSGVPSVEAPVDASDATAPTEGAK